MFTRSKRLTREAFPHVLSRGRRVSTPHFLAVFSTDTTGYAVVVPKKVARLSVTRHKIKRRVLEAFRTLSTPESALLLFPKQAVAEMSYAEVREELDELLSKIGR
ncbi:MAG: Ribonuclease [Candidatus Parcubacteria bacterium]